MRSPSFLASLILHGAVGVAVAWWVPMKRSGLPGSGGSTPEFNALLLDSPAEAAAEEALATEVESLPEKLEPEPEPQLGIEVGSPIITAEKALADLFAPSVGLPEIDVSRPAAKPARPARMRRSSAGTAGLRAGGGGGAGRYTPPRYARCPAPTYPAAAREAHQSGLALLRVFVDSDGSVVRVALARSTGSRVLDNAALATVRTWRFVPAQLDQTPVAAEVEVPVRFLL
jgi:protein TonB